MAIRSFKVICFNADDKPLGDYILGDNNCGLIYGISKYITIARSKNNSSPIRLSLQLNLVTSIHHEYKLHHPCTLDTEPLGLPGNTLADSEAKRGSTLSQSCVPIDLASAKAQIRRTGHQEFYTRYLADPHSATHRTLTGEASPQFHWRLGL